jgi:hypothetical protein
MHYIYITSKNIRIKLHILIIYIQSCRSTLHADAKGERAYSSYSFSTSALYRGKW